VRPDIIKLLAAIIQDGFPLAMLPRLNEAATPQESVLGHPGH
jgi:hypothetical protein